MKTKRDRSLQLNIVFAIIGQITSLLINLVSKNAILSYPGVDYLGLQSVFSNFADLLLFGFSGIGTAMLFHLYKALSNKDKILASSIFHYFDLLCKKVTYAVTGLGILSIFILPFLINATIPLHQIIIGYTLYLLAIIIYNRHIYRQFFIIASQHRYQVTIIITILDFIALFFEIYCLAILHNYLLFLGCIIIKNVAINSMLKIRLIKNYSYLFSEHKALTLEHKQQILKSVKDLFFYRVGTVLVNSTDSTITSSLISTAMAGYYSNYLFVAMGVMGLTSSFFEAIAARIGHIISTNSKYKQFDTFIITSLVNVAITGITCSCLYLLIQDFLILWMGQDAVLPTMIAVMITINYYLNTTHRALSSFRTAAGLFQKVNKIVFIKAAINIILSVILGYHLGLFGILFATAISDILTMQWYEPYLICRYFNKSILFEIAYQTVSLSTTLLCLLVTKQLTFLNSVSTWPQLFMKAMNCGLISLIFYGILFILGKPIFHRFNKGVNYGE